MKLTQTDVAEYDAEYGGHIFLFPNNEIGPAPFSAKACVECRPFCEHGEDLTPQEIAIAKQSGRALSAQCPVCCSSTDPNEWSLFLRRIGFSEYRGMSPAMHYIPTSDGGVHGLGQKKNFIRAGGSKQIEHADAQSKTRSDMDAKSTRRKGHGSNTYDDEQVRVNDLGDPTSIVPSAFVDRAEQIRSASTTEHIEAQVADDKELEDAGKESKPEHQAEDLAADKPEPEVDGKEPKLSKRDKALLKDIRLEIADDLKESFDEEYEKD